MNKRFLVALATAGLMGCSMASLANFNTDCGIYVGGQLGWGQTDYGFSTLRDIGFGFDDIDEDGGVAGRIYLGYQFNPYVGVEIGAALFSDVDFPQNLGSLQTSQFDALLKVGMPFGCSCFRGDIKAGVAAVHSEFDDGDDCHHHFRNNFRHHGDDSLDNTEAKFALGASLTYSVNRCVAVDLSYLHVFGNPVDFNDLRNNRHNNDDNFAPTTDLVTFGVSYMFL